ncbi:MAG: hypothetical protein C5B49_04010 [Bdellovibrio sp.]|nr:MAG: hypothetical protein C5B49_04010 [Bdellovibrio sp.]
MNLLGLNSTPPANSADTTAAATTPPATNYDNCAANPNSPSCASQRNPPRPEPAAGADDSSSKKQSSLLSNSPSTTVRDPKQFADNTDPSYRPSRVRELNLGQAGGGGRASPLTRGGGSAIGPEQAHESYTAPNGGKPGVHRGTYASQGASQGSSPPIASSRVRGSADPTAAYNRNSNSYVDPKARSALIRRRIAASAHAMKMSDLESKRLASFGYSPVGAMRIVGPDGITDPYHDCWGKVNAGYHKIFDH